MREKEKTTMRIQDMTSGNPLKLILTFALPLFIGNIFQQVYSMVDTMVVGYKLGDPAIAAIGATSSLYMLIINFAIGLNNGFGIVVSQRFGAHREKDVQQAIAGMFLLNTGIIIVLTVVSTAFLRPLMGFMNIPKGIFENAYIYIFIICCGMIFTIVYNMFAAILRAVGNSRTPLYFLILACVVNIVLDGLFVLIFDWKIAGAAIATVIAQGVSAIWCGVYVVRNYRVILPGREECKVPKKILVDLTSTGLSMALMLCVVDLGSVIFQRANNLLGETMITAHAAVRRIMDVLMEPLKTIATANSTFVGQNYGAKKFERIRSSLKKVLGVEVLWAVFVCAIVYLFGSVMVRFTTGTTDVEVVKNAVMSLRIHFTLFPVLGILFCLRTTLQAMGRKIAPVVSSCIELVMKIFAAAWMIPTLGFLGTCITEPITWTFMVIFLATAFLVQRKKLFGGEL